MSLHGKQSTFYQMINYSLFKKIIPFLVNSRDLSLSCKLKRPKIAVLPSLQLFFVVVSSFNFKATKHKCGLSRCITVWVWQFENKSQKKERKLDIDEIDNKMIG